jgi:crossover junction endodeoxyribonuclease RuvC
MKILGIDPGSRNCGFAIVENVNNKNKLITAGVIKIKSRILQEQLLEMDIAFDSIFSEYEINEVAMEDIFFAHNPQSVMKLAQFRGALSLKILHKFGSFGEYTPLQVKQSITGNGKASKEQVAFMVKRLLGLKKDIKPLDITDAIAVAITHTQRIRFNQ